MKRSLVLLVLLSATIAVFGLSIGVLAGKEMGGLNRYYVGASLNTGGLIGLGLDAYYVVSSFENAGEELQNASVFELDPLLLLNLELGVVELYAGAGPMVIFNVETMNFELYSTALLRFKVGAGINIGIIRIFLDGLTSFSYSPFATTGIYSVQLGVGLSL